MYKVKLKLNTWFTLIYSFWLLPESLANRQFWHVFISTMLMIPVSWTTCVCKDFILILLQLFLILSKALWALYCNNFFSFFWGLCFRSSWGCPWWVCTACSRDFWLDKHPQRRIGVRPMDEAQCRSPWALCVSYRCDKKWGSPYGDLRRSCLLHEWNRNISDDIKHWCLIHSFVIEGQKVVAIWAPCRCLYLAGGETGQEHRRWVYTCQNCRFAEDLL